MKKSRFRIILVSGFLDHLRDFEKVYNLYLEEQRMSRTYDMCCSTTANLAQIFGALRAQVDDTLSELITLETYRANGIMTFWCFCQLLFNISRDPVDAPNGKIMKLYSCCFLSDICLDFLN